MSVNFNINSFLEIFNPFSDEVEEAISNFDLLTNGEKVAVVALTIIAGVGTFFLLGIGAVPAFKLSVDYFTTRYAQENSDLLRVVNQEYFSYKRLF